MTHMRNELRRMYHGGKELKRMYHQKQETWSGLATYEKSNSILEYTWRQYRLGTNYRWDVYTTLEAVIESSTKRAVAERNWISGYANCQAYYGTIEFRDYIGVISSGGYANYGGAPHRLVYKGRDYYDDYHLYDIYALSVGRVKNQQAGQWTTVTSSFETTYPNPGASGDYWYENRTSYYVRGTYIKDVTSTNSSAYSTSGKTGSYWYDTRTSAYIKGNLIGNVEAEEGTYPTNGRHTDGFWYILQS